MTNLFSTFDPCTGMMSMNWFSSIMFMMLIPYKMWMLSNKISISVKKMLNNLSKEMKMLMSNKGSSLIMMTLFMIILINNLMGLLPYVFTSTAHLVISLSLALPTWLAFMIYGWTKKTQYLLNY